MGNIVGLSSDKRSLADWFFFWSCLCLPTNQNPHIPNPGSYRGEYIYQNTICVWFSWSSLGHTSTKSRMNFMFDFNLTGFSLSWKTSTCTWDHCLPLRWNIDFDASKIALVLNANVLNLVLVGENSLTLAPTMRNIVSSIVLQVV